MLAISQQVKSDLDGIKDKAMLWLTMISVAITARLLLVAITDPS